MQRGTSCTPLFLVVLWYNRCMADPQRSLFQGKWVPCRSVRVILNDKRRTAFDVVEGILLYGRPGQGAPQAHRFIPALNGPPHRLTARMNSASLPPWFRPWKRLRRINVRVRVVSFRYPPSVCPEWLALSKRRERLYPYIDGGTLPRLCVRGLKFRLSVFLLYFNWYTLHGLNSTFNILTQFHSEWKERSIARQRLMSMYY